jgi:hypothetical protein
MAGNIPMALDPQINNGQSQISRVRKWADGEVNMSVAMSPECSGVGGARQGDALSGS